MSYTNKNYQYRNNKNYHRSNKNYHHHTNNRRHQYNTRNESTSINKQLNIKHKTQHTWSIYAHDKKDTDWSNASYKKCYVIRTLEDFWLFFHNIDDFTRHQFYIMKNKILPRFECKENKNGGSLSFMIMNSLDVNDTFIRVVARMIGEQMVDPEYKDEITGLSLNPKIEGANLKIWFTSWTWLQYNDTKIYTSDIRTLESKRLMKHKIT